MSFHRALPFILTALGGVAIGWVIKPSASHVDTAKATNEPVLKREDRRAGNEDSRIAARWIDKMGTGDPIKMGEVAKQVPAGEMKAVLNELIDGVWGSLSDKELERMKLLIAEWTEKDPEGALAWARNLRHPQQRELGLSCIALAIGSKDPEKGFEIYAELEKAQMPVDYNLAYGVISTAYKNAAKNGPEALLEFLRRTPVSDGGGGGLAFNIEYPQGFDFATLMDGLAQDGYFKSFRQGDSKRFSVHGTLGEWAVRDREAAFTYLTEHAKEGTAYPLDQITTWMENKQGKAQTQAWLGEKLSALDSTQRQQLIKGSMLSCGPDELKRFIEAMPTPEAATEFRYEILQAAGEAGWGGKYGILNEVPEIEDRLAVIERLQNMRDTERLETQLKEWNVPQDRIDGIVEKVKRKE